MSTTLLLLRHGQIKANKEGRWHGSTDSPLTWSGRRQAKRTGKHLANLPRLDAVYASPLERCQHTAKLASAHQDIDIQTVDGLREMGVGEWENMAFRDLASQHDFVNRCSQDIHYRAPGGESLAEVAHRVSEALQEIDAQHDDSERVLVVSHGVALAVALAVFLHDSPAQWVKYHFNNCSLSELLLSPEPVVRTFNETAHL